MENSTDVVYSLNERDEIVCVNDAWDRFALANQAGYLAGGQVLSRSLWHFVSDLTTRQLYRDMLVVVRRGRRVRFPFRCDSPEHRRYMEMEISIVPGDAVEFRVRILSEEGRPPQELWEPLASRTGEWLRACSWCKRVDVGGEWVEVEEAVVRLQLMERPRLPPITHSICAPCKAEMMGILEVPAKAL